MLELDADQKLQLLLVGGPILSLIGTWMSLRTYGRLKQRQRPSPSSAQSEPPGAGPVTTDAQVTPPSSRSEHVDRP